MGTAGAIVITVNVRAMNGNPLELWSLTMNNMTVAVTTNEEYKDINQHGRRGESLGLAMLYIHFRVLLLGW